MSFLERPRMQLASGGRMRLTHGPIDVIVTAEGPAEAMDKALMRAREAFAPILTG